MLITTCSEQVCQRARPVLYTSCKSAGSHEYVGDAEGLPEDTVSRGSGHRVAVTEAVALPGTAPASETSLCLPVDESAYFPAPPAVRDPTRTRCRNDGPVSWLLESYTPSAVPWGQAVVASEVDDVVASPTLLLALRLTENPERGPPERPAAMPEGDTEEELVRSDVAVGTDRVVGKGAHEPVAGLHRPKEGPEPGTDKASRESPH